MMAYVRTKYEINGCLQIKAFMKGSFCKLASVLKFLFEWKTLMKCRGEIEKTPPSLGEFQLSEWTV